VGIFKEDYQMAVTEANLLRKIKGGNVYTGCTLPTAYGVPTLTAGVPAGGTDIGATIGETVFTYNASIETVEIEQTTSRVAPHVTNEEVQMTFTIGETTADNLKVALSQTHVATVVNSGTYSVLHLGGHIDVTGNCVAVVAEKSNQPGLYYGGMIYNAYIAGAVNVSHKRSQVQQISVTLAGSALLTRSDGDRLGQYFDQSA
jgi:hypothetical protein